MNPVERLITWLWDPSGNRRRSQIVREGLTDRAIARRRKVHEQALAQIRRTEQLAEQVRTNGTH